MAPYTRTLRTIQRMCLALIGVSLLASFLPLPMPALTSVFMLALVASVVGTVVALIDFWVNARHAARESIRVHVHARKGAGTPELRK